MRKREKGSADIVVKAFSGDDAPLVVSTVLFNAPPYAELDLTIPAEALPPLSLFEKIARKLAPVLEDLKAEDWRKTRTIRTLAS